MVLLPVHPIRRPVCDDAARAPREIRRYKVATFVPPYWLLWFASFFVAQARGVPGHDWAESSLENRTGG